MVHRYHDATKHHFERFARSIGHLDWASQPHPFRSFAGAGLFQLPQHSLTERHSATYDQLFGPSPIAPEPVSAGAIGEVLRYSLGLSAWKQFRESRWALRVNPSSGNLHPTEAYVVTGPVAGLAETAGVYHYAPDRHALEERCAFDAAAWTSIAGDAPLVALVVLTSIHWREAWKYGERAFRYCQHDLGHAIAAIRFATALVGWKAVIVPGWSQSDIATLAGLDRDDDFAGAEREESQCVLALTADPRLPTADCRLLTDSVRAGRWSGRANQLSRDHVEWPIIDEVARATESAGRDARPSTGSGRAQSTSSLTLSVSSFDQAQDDPERVEGSKGERDLDARHIILKRRSATAFDGRSSIDRQTFLLMLARTLPGARAPWDALWWAPRIHLVLFVHRVDGVDPGLYVLVRSTAAVDRLNVAFGREFLWEAADDRVPLFCLARGDCRRMAQRLSCDQEIASDGFFSLGMIAEFDASLAEYGPSFYRHLFWESGFVGQVLYLEAEAAGARATGIGCFYDDPVHDVLGLTGHAFQSLYHFTVGIPVEDSRLTTEPGYQWEKPSVDRQH